MSVTPSNQVQELRGRLAGALRDHWALFLMALHARPTAASAPLQ